MLLGLVVILEIGVLHFLPKCASNGVMYIVFFVLKFSVVVKLHIVNVLIKTFI